MTHYYVFNGDADGLCALQQLRLAEAPQAVLVTGVKRDIQLLRRIEAGCGDQVTVLFDEHGYRELFVPVVLERGLLQLAPGAR